MATLTETYRSKPALSVFVNSGNRWVGKHAPRRCMVVSVGLILAGLSIPPLIVFEVLPATLLVCFVGFVLTATGSLLALVRCGEM
jgi:uncharacterized membrane protein YdjX (TVP38/TMEM64 family)